MTYPEGERKVGVDPAKAKLNVSDSSLFLPVPKYIGPTVSSL